MVANLENEEGIEGTWQEQYHEEIVSDPKMYNIALYWTITTITTVGYGDISGTNSLERAYCSCIMIVGVISFSFANGSLASILSSYDQTNAMLKEKMDNIQKILTKYKINSTLQIKIQ